MDGGAGQVRSDSSPRAGIGEDGRRSDAARPMPCAAGLVVIAIAIGIAYGSTLGFEHFGWDTYPLIASSRIEAPGDGIRILTVELMDGRYPGGHFYRPLTSLSFGLDWLIWRGAPGGYHLTDLLLLLAATVAVTLLARELLRGVWGPVVAAAIFALHPLQIEVVPVSARRADTLATFFTLAAIGLAIRHVRSATSRHALMAAACVGLATAAKETGAISAVMVFCAYAIFGTAGGGLPRRLGVALRRSLPALAALVAIVVARLLVIGGLGGHSDGSVVAAVLGGPQALLYFGRALLVPQPAGLPPGAVNLLAGCLAAGLVAVLGASCLHLARSTTRGPMAFSAIQAILLLACWTVALSWMTATSGRLEPWYAIPFMPVYSLTLGWVVACSIGSEAWLDARPLRWSAIAVVCALLASHLFYSPLLRTYPEWRQLSEKQAAFLGDVRGQIRTLETGTGAVVRGMPVWQDRLGVVGVRGAAGLADYSVQAFADLHAASHPVRIAVSAGDRVPVASPGTVQIDVVPAVP